MCHLETIRQYDNEALVDYMRRFQEAINKISSLDEREALSIFRRNLDLEHNERSFNVLQTRLGFYHAGFANMHITDE